MGGTQAVAVGTKRPGHRSMWRLSGVSLLTVALLALGCAKSAGAVEARADVPRAGVVGTNPGAAVASTDALGTDLYRRLAARPGNLVFSPASIATALAMTRQGAKGETRTQMDAVLHAASGDELDQALNALDQQLATRAGHKGDDTRNGDVALSSANALFGQQGTSFEQQFLEALARYYGAGMRLVDYKAAAEAARLEINQWASDRTNGKIVDLLPAGSLTDLTRLVLVDAVYFKAPWAKRFGADGDQPFTRADGSVVSAPAMTVSTTGGYSQGPGWQTAEIPYLGGELSMVVIMPDDLAAFEGHLDGPTLGAIVSGPRESLTMLRMPKFSFRTEVSLREQLSALGMPLAFTLDADFSGMTKAEQLKIDDVYHQAFIAVDEEGTEAAAATAVVMEAVSAPCCTSLIVDKPFLFAVRDVPTGAVLFLGRVTDPTAT